MRKGLAAGKIAQPVERRLGHAPAGVGEVTQALRGLGGPVLVDQLYPEWGAGEPRHPVLAQPHHVAGQQVVDEHYMGAGGEPGGELAEARVEAQQEGGEDAVLLVVLQVLAHARAAHQQVAVRQHDALRLAGAAGGVEDRRDVEVDGAGLQHVAVRHEALPGRDPRLRVGRERGVYHDHLLHRGVLRQVLAQPCVALGGGHEYPHGAVVEDVGHLLRPQERVDGYEHAARGRRPEHRRDGLDPLVQVDRHALAAFEPDVPQAAGEGRRLLPERRS